MRLNTLQQQRTSLFVPYPVLYLIRCPRIEFQTRTVRQTHAIFLYLKPSTAMLTAQLLNLISFWIGLFKVLQNMRLEDIHSNEFFRVGGTQLHFSVETAISIAFVSGICWDFEANLLCSPELLQKKYNLDMLYDVCVPCTFYSNHFVHLPAKTPVDTKPSVFTRRSKAN